jgi:hypothetical protein
VLLALDPKIRSCGVALFTNAKTPQLLYQSPPPATLYRAGWVPGLAAEGNDPETWKKTALGVLHWIGPTLELAISEIVFERPPAYWADSPKKTLHLQGLLGVCCVLAGMFSRARATAYYPKEWKGTLNKEQTEARANARLSHEEITHVTLTQNKDHNSDIWDSIGIGLRFLGRFEPRKVYAR